MRRRYPFRIMLILAAIATAIAVPPAWANAETIAATDFTGRTVSGKTASNITWSTFAVEDPGDLTAIDEEPTSGAFAALFDTSSAAGHFAPDKNTGNEGPWSVDVPLVPAAGFASITLEEVVLDWQHFNNSGAFQSVNRSVDWTVTVTGSSSGLIATKTAQNVTGKSGLETLAFDSPLVLPAADTYVLNINATGSNGDGNNTGLDGLTINGSAVAVPEPSSLALIAFGALLLLRRRR